MEIERLIESDRSYYTSSSKLSIYGTLAKAGYDAKTLLNFSRYLFLLFQPIL